MGDKTPKRPPAKKPAQTLKQKRAAKQAKRDQGSAPPLAAPRSPRRGV